MGNYHADTENDRRAPWNRGHDDDPARDEVMASFWMEDGHIYQTERQCGAEWKLTYEVDRDTAPEDAEEDMEAMFVAPAFWTKKWRWSDGDCWNPWRQPEDWGFADDDLMPIAVGALYALREEQAQEQAERMARFTQDEIMLDRDFGGSH